MREPLDYIYFLFSEAPLSLFVRLNVFDVGVKFSELV